MKKRKEQNTTRPRLCDLLPPLTPEEYERLKTSLATRGYVGDFIICDQSGGIVDGFHRERACGELGVFCPRELRHFKTEEEKYELALRLNCRRRQLTGKQKQALIETYLRCDARTNDKQLADIIGVSQNTVAKVRQTLVATFQIEKFDTLRGRDGKERPTKYKRIVANTAKEVEAALEALQDLPDNCEGRTLDVLTARRRARRNKKQKDRESRTVKPFADGDKRGRWPDVSRVNSKEKDWHRWQQPLAEVENLVRYFSQPNDLVVDPCGGGFTTAAACYRLGRRCISCDCEESCVAKGKQRLAAVVAGLPDSGEDDCPEWPPARDDFALDETENWFGRKLTEVEEAMRRFFADKSWWVGGKIPLVLLYGDASMLLVRETESTIGLRQAADELGENLGPLVDEMRGRGIADKYHGGLALLYRWLCQRRTANESACLAS